MARITGIYGHLAVVTNTNYGNGECLRRNKYTLMHGRGTCLQCFDTVGWMARRASGL